MGKLQGAETNTKGKNEDMEWTNQENPRQSLKDIHTEQTLKKQRR